MPLGRCVGRRGVARTGDRGGSASSARVGRTGRRGDLGQRADRGRRLCLARTGQIRRGGRAQHAARILHRLGAGLGPPCVAASVVAGPADRRPRGRDRPTGGRRSHPCPQRPAARPDVLGPEGALDPRHRGCRPEQGAGRRHRARHGGQFHHEPLRWAARDRGRQCVAHATARHRCRGLECRTAGPLRRARGRSADGVGLRRTLPANLRSGSPAGRRPNPRRDGRFACGPVRSWRQAARRGQGHAGHRVVRHGAGRGGHASRPRPVPDHRLGGGPTGLCGRGQYPRRGRDPALGRGSPRDVARRPRWHWREAPTARASASCRASTVSGPRGGTIGPSDC